MKNSNISRSILYGTVGAILGAFVAVDLTLLPQYLSDVWQKPELGELSMVFYIFGTPILVLAGIILGVLYARKYRNK